MIYNPDKIIFENSVDVVNYVSSGIVPTRKYYGRMINKVSSDDAIFINCDKDTMLKAVDIVYKNRVKNRNIAVGIIGAIALGIFIGTKNSSKNEDEDDE